MRKTIFIILSVLGISAFISCKEQKHLTTDEPSQPTTEEPLQPTTDGPSQPTTEEPLQPTTDGPSQPVTDIDGNEYKTVKLGNQVWMAENLRTTRYADGTPIPLGTEASLDVAYRYYPNYNRANVSKYGYLYNWAAVMNGSASSEANPSGVQGICPDGWHVPSDAEWTELTNYVSSQSQYVCGDDTNYIAKALASEVDGITIHIIVLLATIPLQTTLRVSLPVPLATTTATTATSAATLTSGVLLSTIATTPTTAS